MPVSRRRAPRAEPSREMSHASATQIDLFPERPVVERLDPRASVGPRTGVLSLTRVRVRAAEAPHLIFHDRHGWYCEAHGPSCAAVQIARAEDPA